MPRARAWSAVSPIWSGSARRADDVRADLGKRQGAALTDSAPCAGHQGDLAIESETVHQHRDPSLLPSTAKASSRVRGPSSIRGGRLTDRPEEDLQQRGLGPWPPCIGPDPGAPPSSRWPGGQMNSGALNGDGPQSRGFEPSSGDSEVRAAAFGSVLLPFSPALVAEPTAQHQEQSETVSVEGLVLDHVGVGIDPAVVAEPDHPSDEQDGKEERVVERSRRRAGLRGPLGSFADFALRPWLDNNKFVSRGGVLGV